MIYLSLLLHSPLLPVSISLGSESHHPPKETPLPFSTTFILHSVAYFHIIAKITFRVTLLTHIYHYINSVLELSSKSSSILSPILDSGKIQILYFDMLNNQQSYSCLIFQLYCLPLTANSSPYSLSKHTSHTHAYMYPMPQVYQTTLKSAVAKACVPSLSTSDFIHSCGSSMETLSHCTTSGGLNVTLNSVVEPSPHASEAPSTLVTSQLVWECYPLSPMGNPQPVMSRSGVWMFHCPDL